MKIKFRTTALPQFDHVAEVVTAAGEEMELPCTFRHRNLDELDALTEQAINSGPPANQARFLLEEVLEGWGAEDEHGQPVPLDHAALTAAIRTHPNTGAAIWFAFLEGLRGARRKN